MRSLHIDVAEPVATPVFQDVDMSARKQPGGAVDDDIVALVKQIEREEKEEEKLAKIEISDSVHEWVCFRSRTRMALLKGKHILSKAGTWWWSEQSQQVSQASSVAAGLPDEPAD